ncbi:hypothetical protein M8C17_16765 [Micromonospora sp. RHAY321]|uniref:hypothetical protein n=1 Tax=Micromonospora sp. RHAY321 TaxID=2944807 RepID=UPI00207C3E2C|nr:hypothetical protein [Micromonospora sp. RHAY321]MCO1596809.1 hypothetical protein [Micromonospora sp. RHAY321]
MDKRRWVGLAVVPLLGGASLVGPVAPAVAAAPEPAARAATAPGNELYVSSQGCTSGADGSEWAPYCTISAAAAVVQPGQTVLVQPGEYPESVDLTRSGAEGAPITFRAVNTLSGPINVGNLGATVVGSVFRIANVHDVVVEGFHVVGTTGATPVVVDTSTRVTINDIATRASGASAAVHVTGSSRAITISRSWLNGSGTPAIRIDADVSGSKVVGNQLYMGGLLAAGADTVVTNNTVITNCVRGIDATATSTGLSIQNNIVRTSPFHGACKTPQDAIAIAVGASAASGAVADYNLIDPISGGPSYHWAGTAYPDLASFRAATGQGGHDLAADPLIGASQSGPRAFLPADPASPAVDSANAAAPGVPGTDMFGNPHSDNPAVANTGTGNGFHDRGAIEVQGPLKDGQYDLRHKAGDDSFAVTATGIPQYTWPVDGEGGTIAYQFDGARYPRTTTASTVAHSFGSAGRNCVSISISYDGFRRTDPKRGSRCTRVGARYTPSAPTRVLDTRAAVGIATTTPVPANGEVVVAIPAVGGVSAADISAVVLNLTVTAPTAAGFIGTRPEGGVVTTSSVNFVANETVPNLVTTSVRGGVVRLVNRSGGTVHLIADLQGVYSRHGSSGFMPLDPARVLDTRTGAGTPLAANGERRLDLSGKLPADATAAVVNVTVTGPTTAGVLTVYPDGSPVPLASNLNFVARQTIPNLVTVPVVAGKVMIRNVSSGTTHVIVDLAGYYGSVASGANQTYVPSEARIADSRVNAGWIKVYDGPFNPFAKGSVAVFGESWCGQECPPVTAAALNLTVTAPTAGGVLTAYPSGVATPSASNVNFVAGETASNLAVVRVGDGYVDAFNNSSGQTHVVVDQSGYFFAPVF